MTERHLVEPLPEVEIKPEEFNAYVTFVKAHGVFVLTRPFGLRIYQKVKNADRVIGYLNTTNGAAGIGLALSHISGTTGDAEFNRRMAEINERAQFVRRQVQQFLQPLDRSLE
jgi:hypothetical protein